ncbi:hypothetical protein [Agromyces laixinhei]|uniref:hypothetical protein n=1 Tax=Agromyces laixinhei TaxID=2585717 RepID=UPI0011176954|nr:hypothetical protein [Agromyces laixinhei]
MSSDSHLSAIAARHLGIADASERRIERARFVADINDLELRLAIIDDRFERLASRSDERYQDWRRDTATKCRDLAIRARSLEDDGRLEAHLRRQVAAVLVTIRARVAALDARRSALLDRRSRARVES